MKPSFSDHPTHLTILREAALRAADPAAAVRRSLAASDLACRGRIYVVGAGKAGTAMAGAAEEILGDRIAAGAVSVPALPHQPGRRLEYIVGGHPLPAPGSIIAGENITRLFEKTTAEDLVLVLLSGGASTLLELPHPEIPLEDLQAATEILLKSGAAIAEINRLRSPLSLLKAGGLLRLAHPARVLSLILSDVVGSPLETIASGPTVLRKYSAQEIATVLEKYRLRTKLPPSVISVLDQYASQAPEPAPSEVRVENRIIASNRIAAEAAGKAAGGLGFRLASLADDWQGEAREAGKRFAEMILRERGREPACWIAGGETTVTVRGAGMGGRNQEAALAAAIALDGKPEIALAMLATDGVDGPTDAAGAVVTGRTIGRARERGMDPHRFLDDNNSYAFFSALGDLLHTGPTGTNVNDIWIGLTY